VIRVRLEEAAAAARPEEQEDCVACGHPTPYWTDIRTRKPGDQVPCCPGCGARLSATAMPSKALWMSDAWTPPPAGDAERELGSVDAFNAQNPPLTVVNYKREGRGHGQRTRTAGPAWVGGDGRAVVRLEGIDDPAPLAWVCATVTARKKGRRHGAAVETHRSGFAAE